MPSSSPPSPPLLFPTYLVPSLPFRRRQSSTSSETTPTASPTEAVATTTEPYLTSHTSHLRCARCLSDLALSSQIISKGFTGRHGRAYLVSPSSSSPTSPSSMNYPFTLKPCQVRNDLLPNLPNTYVHKPVQRQLVTGTHTVGDISCVRCDSMLGWKYVAADDEAQRYKVGKFILETRRVCRGASWEEDGEVDGLVGAGGGARRMAESVMPPNELAERGMREEIEFDSQDEEECEDLFLGVWTPQLAARRRKSRRLGKE